MDAMKHFTEGMIKENKPQFEVGDTVRVSVRIKEGDKERIQAFEGTVIARSMAASRRPSPSAAPLTVLALSVCSRSTARSSRRLTSFAAARSVVRSCSTCASAPARLPRSRHVSEHTRKGEDGWRSPFFRIFLNGWWKTWQHPSRTATAAIRKRWNGTTPSLWPWRSLRWCSPSACASSRWTATQWTRHSPTANASLSTF